jgi:hypothetical protein
MFFLGDLYQRMKRGAATLRWAGSCAQRPILRATEPNTADGHGHWRVASAQHVARGMTKETYTITRNTIPEESFCIVGRV